MKKKVFVALSTMVLIVVCAVTLVACIPNRPDKFLANFLFAEKWSMEMKMEDGTISLNCNGDDMSLIMKDGDNIITETYIMNEDGKSVVYSKLPLQDWMRIDTGVESAIKQITDAKKVCLTRY